jgi:serine/threonine protein kinase
MIEGTESFKKRYKVLNRISEGNFGCVFKARDTLTSPLYLLQTN